MVVGVIVVLLIIALPFAKRREQRRRRTPRSTGDIGSAIRAGKEHKISVQLRDRPTRPPRR
ncbi:MAG: hypothetical protein QOI74_3710 [Micromonosporaceae bacterium]|nr:hypothetical protein [Micromonosporaceae bacterium]